MPNGVVQQGSNLVIFDATPEISGDYVCILYTPEGQMRQQIRVTVEEPRQAPVIFSPNSKTTQVPYGGSFKLECVAQGSPRPSIRIETPRRSAGPYPPAAFEAPNTRQVIIY